MGRPPGFDRDQVVQAVQRQFRRSGYAGTSLDDISTAAGLGRGSLYAAFGDKHQLFLESLDAYCTHNEQMIAEMLGGSDDDALLRLQAFVLSGARFAADDPDNLGCMAGRFALEVAAQDEDAAKRIKRDFDALRSHLTACVEGAQRHGDLDPDVEAQDLATLMLSTARGMDVLASGGVSTKSLEAAANHAFRGLPITKKGQRLLAKTQVASA